MLSEQGINGKRKIGIIGGETEMNSLHERSAIRVVSLEDGAVHIQENGQGL